MPTIFTHGLMGLTASHTILPEPAEKNRKIRRLFIGLSVILPVVPDLDGLTLLFIPYSHPFGHRGFSHSLFFAVLLGALAAVFVARRAPELRSRWGWLFIYFTLLVASHGFFDAMTRGGLGIAFFAPFDNSRYFFPIRPIPASPIWPNRFISVYGARALLTEISLIWLVCIALLVGKRRLAPIVASLQGGLDRAVKIMERKHRWVAAGMLFLAALLWAARLTRIQ